MDKIQSSNSGGSVPLWERQKSHRGHKTSVNSALDAHRQRVTERQARIEKRLSVARGVSTRFFPKPVITETPLVEPGQVQLNQNQNQLINNAQIQNQIPDYVPELKEMDVLYDDAQMSPVANQALQLIEKDLNNPSPENAPPDETPRGSYVDYVV